MSEREEAGAAVQRALLASAWARAPPRSSRWPRCAWHGSRSCRGRASSAGRC